METIRPIDTRSVYVEPWMGKTLKEMIQCTCFQPENSGDELMQLSQFYMDPLCNSLIRLRRHATSYGDERLINFEAYINKLKYGYTFLDAGIELRLPPGLTRSYVETILYWLQEFRNVRDSIDWAIQNCPRMKKGYDRIEAGMGCFKDFMKFMINENEYLDQKMEELRAFEANERVKRLEETTDDTHGKTESDS